MLKKIILLLIILLVALTFGCVNQPSSIEPSPIEPILIEDTNFSFLIYGDSRGGGNINDFSKYEAHKKIISLMKDENYEFIIKI